MGTPARSYGKRRIAVNVLTGSVIPLWKELEQLVTTSMRVKQDDRRMRIVQVAVNASDEHLVGILWPESIVDELVRLLARIKDERAASRDALIVRGLKVSNVPCKVGPPRARASASQPQRQRATDPARPAAFRRGVRGARAHRALPAPRSPSCCNPDVRALPDECVFRVAELPRVRPLGHFGL
jgi:hypothetical protein